MMDVQIALMLDFQLKKKIFEEASNQDGGLSLYIHFQKDM